MNHRQKLFCIEYLKDFNASQAAGRAGYNGRANMAGPRLMANDGIRTEIAAKAKEILDRPLDDLRLRIRDEYEKIAFAKEGVRLQDRLTALAQLAKYADLVKDAPAAAVQVIAGKVIVNIATGRRELDGDSGT